MNKTGAKAKWVGDCYRELVRGFIRTRLRGLLFDDDERLSSANYYIGPNIERADHQTCGGHIVSGLGQNAQLCVESPWAYPNVTDWWPTGIPSLLWGRERASRPGESWATSSGNALRWLFRCKFLLVIPDLIIGDVTDCCLKSFYDVLEPKITELTNTMANQMDDKLQMELTSILVIIM